MALSHRLQLVNPNVALLRIVCPFPCGFTVICVIVVSVGSSPALPCRASSVDGIARMAHQFGKFLAILSASA